tara:strand:- start:1059 stop:5066 length:4008 start_codon:yes stop_codon:yes gene_type:complete
MSSTFIDGVGFVAIDSRKSAEERDATVEYYKTMAPKYEELGGFSAGFNDTQSIIYRWWENFNKTDDEEKDTWFKEQVGQWGQMVGYTDSQALEKYHADIENLRPLSSVEQADREANNVSMKEFEADMYDAYDNANGDISDVQQKYGYDEEDIGVLEGLGMFAKMAMESPAYTLGSVAGMVAKDPELLLLSYLRIPSIAAQGTVKATQLAQRALSIQPKYVQNMSKIMQSQRTQAVVGRGVEGAVYGGVYEGLHDLTFNGHIKGENMERGIAMGALLGSAFGSISKSTGNRSWLLSRQGSINAEKNISALNKDIGGMKWQEVLQADGTKTRALGYDVGWQAKMEQIQLKNKGFELNPKTNRYEPPVAEKINPKDFSADNVNPNFGRSKLPDGLDNATQALNWRNRFVDLLEGRTPDGIGIGSSRNEINRLIHASRKQGLTKSEAEQLAKESFALRADDLIQGRAILFKGKKNKDGTRKYTNEEASALATKELVKEQEKLLSPKQRKAEGIKEPNKKDWGSSREAKWGKENIDKGETVRDSSSFDYIFKEDLGDIPTPTTAQMARAGAVGAGLGFYIADEDKTIGGVMGLVGGAFLRGKVKGINLGQAKIKRRFYEVAAGSDKIRKVLEMEAGKLTGILHGILKDKSARMESLEFLGFVENFTENGGLAGLRKATLTNGSKLTESEIKAVLAFKQVMDDFATAAKEAGILSDNQFVQDYVTHIFRNKKVSQSTHDKFVARLKTKTGSKLDDTSVFQNQRKLIGDIQSLAKEFPDLETDVFKILDAYTRSMSKAIAGRNLTKQLSNTAVMDGELRFSVIMDVAKEGGRIVVNGKPYKAFEYARDVMGYQVSNHPALKNKLIHPLVKKSMDDFYAPEIGSEGLVNKMIVVNNAMKRLAISFSLFHAQSLALSGIYSGMLTEYMTKAGRLRHKKVMQLIKGQWDYHNSDGTPKLNVHGKESYGDLTQAALLREVAEAGVSIGVKASEFVDPGYNTVRALMEKHAPPLAKLQGKIDYATWDMTHDYTKVFTYLTMKDRLMSPKGRGIARIMPALSKMRGKDLGKWEAMSESEARLAASAFTNDAFGGQNHAKLALEWQNKAIQNANNPKGAMYQMFALWTTPSKAKISNLVLFSPDWTISNLRIGFRGMGMTKDIVGKVAKGKKLTPAEMGEWNMYMGYWVRALVSTSMLAYIVQDAFSDEPFDFNNFWMTGRLDLGNGEEMVVSKQIAEPMHWLVNPMQTGLNKASTLPKTGLELIFGKEYISVKHGDKDRAFLQGGSVIGPTLDRGSPKDVAWWLAGKGTPISASQLAQAYRKDEDMWHALKKTMFGSIGFPTYGTKDN